MSNAILIRVGDGVTNEWVLSPSNTGLQTVTVDGYPVMYSQPSWNKVLLASAPAMGAQVAFTFTWSNEGSSTGQVPTVDLTDVEYRISTIEGKLLRPLPNSSVVHSVPWTYSSFTYVEDFGKTDAYPGEPRFVHFIPEDLVSGFEHLTVILKNDQNYPFMLDNSVCVALPDNFDGGITFVSDLFAPVNIVTKGVIAPSDIFAVDAKYQGFAQAAPYAVTNMRYKGGLYSNGATLYQFQGPQIVLPGSVAVPYTPLSLFYSGAIVNNAILGRIITPAGRIRLSRLHTSSSTNHSHDLEVRLRVFYMNTAAGSFYQQALYKSILRAGTKFNHGAWTDLSGNPVGDSDSFVTTEGGYVQIECVYVGTTSPTTQAKEVSVELQAAPSAGTVFPVATMG